MGSVVPQSKRENQSVGHQDSFASRPPCWSGRSPLAYPFRVLCRKDGDEKASTKQSFRRHSRNRDEPANFCTPKAKPRTELARGVTCPATVLIIGKQKLEVKVTRGACLPSDSPSAPLPKPGSAVDPTGLEPAPCSWTG